MKEVVLSKRTSRIFRLPGWPDVCRSGLLLIAARSMVLGALPFGVACFAACTSMETAYLGIIAMALGVYTAGGNVGKYLIACVLFWLYSELKLREDNKLMTMAACGGCVFIGGLYSALAGGTALYSMAVLLAESLLAAMMYHAFRCTDALFQGRAHREASQEQIVSAVVVLGVLLMGVSGVALPFGIDLAVLLGILMVLAVSMNAGVAVSGCFGMAAGFICSMNRPEAVLLTGIFGLSAVLANLLKLFGRLGGSLGFLLGVTVSLLYLGDVNRLSITLTELFAACILYAMLPQFIHQKISGAIGAVFCVKTPKSDVRVKEYLSGELKSFAKAFGDLAEHFLAVPEKQREMYAGNVDRLIDEVAARACTECRMAEECWKTKFEETCRQAYMIFETMERDGYCDMHNLPIVFKQRCIAPEGFVAAFNHVYELYKQNALWKGEASMGRGLVAQQYHEISNIMRELSHEVEGGFCFQAEREKKISGALLRAGVFVKEVSVLENARGGYEVYVSPGTAERETVQELVSEIMGIRMRVVQEGETLKLIADNLYAVETGVRQRTKEGQAVSGDTLKCFETEDKYYVVLCDGMGSGSEALQESGMTAELLARFLKAGLEKETAVNMINSTLALKAEREAFTTVDLLEVDLRTGDAEFLKVGCAESYIKHNGAVETVEAKTLPIGILEEAKPAVAGRTLSGGDCIVLVSDGVSETGYGVMRGEWIKKLLRLEDRDMEELAELILNEAVRKAYPKLSDDMTVVTLRLVKRREE